MERFDLMFDFCLSELLLSLFLGKYLVGCGEEGQDSIMRFKSAVQTWRGSEILLRDRKSTRLNSSHITRSRMPSSA